MSDRQAADAVIAGHISWLNQYVECMAEHNWMDMRLYMRRQLQWLAAALDLKTPDTIRAEGLEDHLSLLTRAVETVCAYSPDDDSDDDFKAAFEQLRATLKRMPV